MTVTLIYISLYSTALLARGGFDFGTAAGKNNWDLSLTINPYNYFESGQSYAIISYGITKNIDVHGYFSYSKNISNYYIGGFYQFIKWKKLDLATALGYRKYVNELGWREFSHSLINNFPEMLVGNLRKEFDNFPWIVNKKYLYAWKKGLTGYPIVDA